MTQDTFEWRSRPVARSTDPETSHVAAASITELTRKQQTVLMVIHQEGPITDHALNCVYNDPFLRTWRPPQSESGLRTRRSELVRKGLVRDSGKRETLPSGRKAIIWEAV